MTAAERSTESSKEQTTLPNLTDYGRQNPASVAQSSHRRRTGHRGQSASLTDYFQEELSTGIRDCLIPPATKSSSSTSLTAR